MPRDKAILSLPVFMTSYFAGSSVCFMLSMSVISEKTEKMELAQQLRELQQHLLEHGLVARFSDTGLKVQPHSPVNVVLTQHSDEDTITEGNAAVNSHD